MANDVPPKGIARKMAAALAHETGKPVPFRP
jgi:hypothetical protein